MPVGPVLIDRLLQPLIRAPFVWITTQTLAALGEAHPRRGAGFNPTFYFNLGSGVGGGWWWTANLPRASAWRNRFGHLRLDRAGTTVESRCSGWGRTKKIRDLTARAPTASLPARRQLDRRAARHLAARWRRAIPTAKHSEGNREDWPLRWGTSFNCCTPRSLCWVAVWRRLANRCGRPLHAPCRATSWKPFSRLRRFAWRNWGRMPCPSAPWNERVSWR